MGSGYETRRTVVIVKSIDHDDEANERPSVGTTSNVHMEWLRGRPRFQRPGVHRTQLEGAADDLATRGQQWAVDV